MKILINTASEVAEIGGETFVQGEWKHRPDEWVEKHAKELAKFPDIKEAHIVLEERTAQVLKENGLDNFAEGLKEAAETYNEPIKGVALDVAKYAPYKSNIAVEAIE